MLITMTSRPPVAAQPAELPAAGCRRAAIALGVFDGVHLGHQAILRELTGLAAKTNASPVALFFDPHPRAVLFPEQPLPLLTAVPHRELLLGAAGAACLIRFPFSPELAAMPPMAFLDRYFLVPDLTITGFCIGENWRFGRRNAGTAATLAEWSSRRQISTVPVPSVRHQEGLVSSTRIRQAVGQGDLAAAAAMLGRPFSLLGRVVHGYGQGSTVLQCPTANLIAENTILPPYGVYAATAQDRERQFRGIVYVGDAPTLRHDSRPRVYVELHLFDCNYDLYDRELHVEFRLFLRPSRKFSSPEELKAQIDRDIKAALAGPW